MTFNSTTPAVDKELAALRKAVDNLRANAANHRVPEALESSHAAVLQRLVRRICDGCRHAEKVGGALVKEFELAPDVGEVCRGVGCDHCRGTGFRGRTGIYELLILDDTIRGELRAARIVSDLRELAISRGMRTLREDGLRLVRAGVTTPEEVLRVTRA